MEKGSLYEETLGKGKCVLVWENWTEKHAWERGVQLQALVWMNEFELESCV